MRKDCLSLNNCETYREKHNIPEMKYYVVKFDFKNKINRMNEIKNFCNDIYFIENDDGTTAIVYPCNCEEIIRYELGNINMQDEYFTWIK